MLAHDRGESHEEGHAVCARGETIRRHTLQVLRGMCIIWPRGLALLLREHMIKFLRMDCAALEMDSLQSRM